MELATRLLATAATNRCLMLNVYYTIHRLSYISGSNTPIALADFWALLSILRNG